MILIFKLYEKMNSKKVFDIIVFYTISNKIHIQAIQST